MADDTSDEEFVGASGSGDDYCDDDEHDASMGSGAGVGSDDGANDEDDEDWAGLDHAQPASSRVRLAGHAQAQADNHVMRGLE
jgi:hypothetical protein